MCKITSFVDLTSYSHRIGPFTLEGVKNVGWLDIESEYPRGALAEPVLLKLKALAASIGAFQPIVEPVRDPLVCQACGTFELFDSAGAVLSNAEIWIPGNGIIYAAPLIILHFIEVHNYLPPAEFIAAVGSLDENTPFVASEIYRRKLSLSGWGMLSGSERRKFSVSYDKRMAERNQSGEWPKKVR